MEPSIKLETPIIELPNDANKLFDEEDDIGTSTIPDLSLPSEDEEEEVKSNNVWEYAIDVLSNYLHSILKGKASGNGSNIKIWKP